MGELAKRVLERRRREDPVSPKQDGFVNIVTRSEGSQNLSTVESLPFQPGAHVAYRVPVIQSPAQHTWQERKGVILAVNDFAEMVLIQPEDEPCQTWRWLWVGYVERATNA